MSSSSIVTAIAELRHESITRKIAVYEGMPPEELDVLVHSAFFPVKSTPEWTRKLVGFLHAKTRTFLPLQIATAFPTLLQPNHTYEVVLERAPEAPKPVQNRVSTWQEKLYAILVQWSTSSPAALSPDQLNRLELLIGQGNPALQQAYTTFEQTQELEGLYAAVHRVLGVVLQQQKSSFTRVVNTLSMLKPHDVALIHELYTQGNDLVLAAWEVYELDEDRLEFADTLLRIVRFKTHGIPPSPTKVKPEVNLSMEGVLKEMVNKQLLTAVQYQGLLRLWKAKNEAMIGAMEAYEADHDIKELVETLLLVVKHAGLTKHKPVPITVPASNLEELHPLSPRVQNVRSPPSYGTFEGKLQSAATTPSEPRTSTPTRSPKVKSPVVKSPKPKLRVNTQLSSSSNSPAQPLSPSAALPLSSRNLPTSPSHYAPDSQEYFVGQLLEQQVQKGVLTPGQFMALKTLLKKQDATLFAAAQAYKENPEDSDALAATLLDLCNVMHWEANHQSILHTWIVPLEQEGRGSGLRDLWNNNDPRMMAAYQLYVHDHNKEDFIDTLVRLASVSSSERDHEEKSQDANDQLNKAEEIDDQVNEAEEASAALDELESAGRLSQDVKEQLDPDDPRVHAALEVYSDNQDVGDLVDTLERIASPKVTQEDENEIQDDEAVDAGVMEKQILHLVYELALPDDELAALKGAIVDNDVVVQAAIQVYEMEKDEDDFKDTLRRVARHLVNANESTPVEEEDS
ncbi:hypothetical protein THRCLA_03288 [Thraustotheca clavata]|uniref:Uncharacterized protein n=1 Tax=Thraustotheca clavata TaxID=74557 RepID=A0A1W0A2G4_9STRA|nr:hypothetical protein THRCLA_03288 [Thraustotheca clavata]